MLRKKDRNKYFSYITILKTFNFAHNIHKYLHNKYDVIEVECAKSNDDELIWLQTYVIK